MTGLRLIIIGNVWLGCALVRGDVLFAKLNRCYAKVERLALGDFALALFAVEQHCDMLELLGVRYGRCSTIVTSSMLVVDSWR